MYEGVATSSQVVFNYSHRACHVGMLNTLLDLSTFKDIDLHFCDSNIYYFISEGETRGMVNLSKIFVGERYQEKCQQIQSQFR